MTERLEVFLLEPVPRVRRTLVVTQMLRRGYECPSQTLLLGHVINRHEARVDLDELPQALHDLTHHGAEGEVLAVPAERWPERCTNPGCPDEGGYVFQKDDPRLVLHERLYRRADGQPGEHTLGGTLPPGAVFDAVSWGLPANRADGRSLCVVTPDGKPWFLDVPSPGGEVFRRETKGPYLYVEQTAGDPWPWKLYASRVFPA